MKHTQGPWHVDEGVDSIENMKQCLQDSLSLEQPWVAVGIHDTDGYAESVAYCHRSNAQLIADAPEMLELLQKIAGLLEDHPEAKIGNSKVHFCFMKAKNYVPEQRINESV